MGPTDVRPLRDLCPPGAAAGGRRDGMPLASQMVPVSNCIAQSVQPVASRSYSAIKC